MPLWRVELYDLIIRTDTKEESYREAQRLIDEGRVSMAEAEEATDLDEVVEVADNEEVACDESPRV